MIISYKWYSRSITDKIYCFNTLACIFNTKAIKRLRVNYLLGGCVIYEAIIYEFGIADAERITPDESDLLVIIGKMTGGMIGLTVGAQEIVDLEVGKTLDLEVDTKTKQVVSEMQVRISARIF